MNFIELLMTVMTGLFWVGVAGCVVTLPFVVWQFTTVLWEKHARPDPEASDAD